MERDEFAVHTGRVWAGHSLMEQGVGSSQSRSPENGGVTDERIKNGHQVTVHRKCLLHLWTPCYCLQDFVTHSSSGNVWRRDNIFNEVMTILSSLFYYMIPVCLQVSWGPCGIHRQEKNRGFPRNV